MGLQFIRFISCLSTLCGSRLAVTCLYGSIFLFLRRVFNESNGMASIQTNLWHGACFLFGAVFGYYADTKFGQPLICLFSMILILIGMGFTFVSVYMFEEKYDDNNENTDSYGIIYLIMYWFGIYLIAIAFAGALPAGISLSGVEFSKPPLKGKIYNLPVFTWIFMTMSVSALTSYTILAYLAQESKFWIPYLAVLGWHGFMLFVFLLSFKHFYATHQVKGESNVITVAKELLFSYKCCNKKNDQQNIRQRYDSIYLIRNQDIKEAMNHEYDRFQDSSNPSNDRDQERKSSVEIVRGLIPFLMTNLLFSCIYWQQLSLLYAQACQMDIKLTSNFNFPISALAAIPSLFVIVFAPMFDTCLYPVLAKIFRFTWSPLKKQGCGIFITMLAMVSVAILEIIRKNKNVSTTQTSTCDESIYVTEMSIFWLLPPYVLFGIAEIMFAIPSMSFYFTQAPESMKTIILAIRGMFNGFGNWLGSLIVLFVHIITGGKWVTNDLNKGHLDYMYFLLAAISFIFFIYFIYISVTYKYHIAEKIDSLILRDDSRGLPEDGHDIHTIIERQEVVPNLKLDPNKFNQNNINKNKQTISSITKSKTSVTGSVNR